MTSVKKASDDSCVKRAIALQTVWNNFYVKPKGYLRPTNRTEQLQDYKSTGYELDCYNNKDVYDFLEKVLLDGVDEFSDENQFERINHMHHEFILAERRGENIIPMLNALAAIEAAAHTKTGGSSKKRASTHRRLKSRTATASAARRRNNRRRRTARK